MVVVVLIMLTEIMMNENSTDNEKKIDAVKVMV